MKPYTSYMLTRSDRVEFCKFLKSVKFFDRFVSNITRYVNERNGKISSLKTHGCHVLYINFYLLVFELTYQKMCTPLLLNCVVSLWFVCKNDKGKWFGSIASRYHNHTLQIRKNISTYLLQRNGTFCRSPTIWTKITGPVSYSWIYLIERSRRTLKQYVRYKTHPEGSIVEGYLMNKSGTFCSRYLSGIETCFTRDEQNDDSILEDKVIGEFEMFVQEVHPLEESSSRSIS